MADAPLDVIRRVAVDPEFRAELLSNPAAANEKYSLHLSAAQIDAIRELDPETIEDSFGRGVASTE